jgi:hypothetical protein
VIENPTTKAVIQLSSGLLGSPSPEIFQELFEYILIAPDSTLLNLLPSIMEYKPAEYDLPLRLRLRHIQLISHHVRQIQWIKHLRELLTSSGLQVILLKGHGLLGRVYSENFPRFSTDIDLLIRPNEYLEATKIISTNATFYGSTPLHSSYIVDFPYAIQVEVHKQIDAFKAFDLNFDAIWSASNPHPMFESSSIRSMSTEDSFIHILIHGFNQYQFHPYMIADAARIISHKNFDFDKLLNRARESGCEYLLRKFLEQFSDYLPATGIGTSGSVRTRMTYRDRLYKSFFKANKIRQSDVLKPFLRLALIDKNIFRIRTLNEAFRSTILRQIKKILA